MRANDTGCLIPDIVLAGTEIRNTRLAEAQGVLRVGMAGDLLLDGEGVGC